MAEGTKPPIDDVSADYINWYFADQDKKCTYRDTLMLPTLDPLLMREEIVDVVYESDEQIERITNEMRELNKKIEEERSQYILSRKPEDSTPIPAELRRMKLLRFERRLLETAGALDDQSTYFVNIPPYGNALDGFRFLRVGEGMVAGDIEEDMFWLEYVETLSDRTSPRRTFSLTHLTKVDDHYYVQYDDVADTDDTKTESKPQRFIDLTEISAQNGLLYLYSPHRLYIVGRFVIIPD